MKDKDNNWYKRAKTEEKKNPIFLYLAKTVKLQICIFHAVDSKGR